MSKIVVFISLPMSGLPDELVMANIERAKEAYLAITKLDISQVAFIHNLYPDTHAVTKKWIDPPEYINTENKKRIWYLGRAINRMAECDEAFFWSDWKKARGCMIEHEVCSLYDIPTISVERSGYIG